MGETRRLGKESWRRLTTGARYGKRKLGALQGRRGAQLTGGAGEGRGSHPALAGRNRTARCTTTPGGAERDPHPRPSSPGSAPNSSSSTAQVKPGRDGTGRGGAAALHFSPRHRPLRSALPWLPPGCLPPTGEGSSPPPSANSEPPGLECGVPGGSGRAPGSPGCFRPGLGGGRGEGGPAGAGGRSGAGPDDAALSPLFRAVAAPRREGRAAGAVFRPSVSG